MNQRLSRKEIKRDEFMESVAEAIEYVRGHARKIVALALVGLALLMAVAAYMAFADRREGRADQALTEALRLYQAPIDPVAANPEDPQNPSFADSATRTERARQALAAVKEDFGRTDAGRIATAYLGQIAASAGDTETARAYWQQFVDRSSDNALAVETRVNLMALDRASGRGDELVTELRALLSGSTGGLPADLLWYQLALTLESLDRQGEAQEAYQRIVDEYPQSAFAPVARERTGGAAAPVFGS